MAEREILKLSRPRVKRPERVKVFEKAMGLVEKTLVLDQVPVGQSVSGGFTTGTMPYEHVMEPVELLRKNGLQIYPINIGKLVKLNEFLKNESDQVKDSWLSVLWSTHGVVK